MFIFVATVIASFLIFSYKLQETAYKSRNYILADLIWRLSIIGSILLVTPGVIKIAFHEVIFVAVFLSCMYSIAYFLSKFYRTDIKAYYIFVSVAGAPLMEEILFRGFLLTLLPGSTKEKIVFSSIIFGLYHAKNYFIKTRFSLIYQIIYATLIAGPIFAFSYIKTGSLIFPIILHSVNNLLALFISEKMVRKLGAKLLI